MRKLIKKILKESIEEDLTNEIYSFTNELYREGVTLRAFVMKDYENNDRLTILLDLIKVNNGKPGEGVRAMNKLIEFADKKALPIRLLTSTNYGMTEEELERFYNKFNFKIIGIHPFTKGKIMYRNPE